MTSAEPQIVLCARWQVEHLLQRHPRIAAVVSISDPGYPPAPGFHAIPYRLHLQFHDSIGPARVRSDDYHPPTIEQVRQLADFAQIVLEHPGPCLIHCSRGVSRSPAAALTCLCAWMQARLGPLSEDAIIQLVQRFFARYSQVYPNRDLVQIADHCLAMHDWLIAAVEILQPGHTAEL